MRKGKTKLTLVNTLVAELFYSQVQLILRSVPACPGWYIKQTGGVNCLQMTGTIMTFIKIIDHYATSTVLNSLFTVIYTEPTQKLRHSSE